MIGKLLFAGLLLVSFTSALEINYEDGIARRFLSVIRSQNRAVADERCTGNRFEINTRGCSWFFVCDDEKVLLREDRCPEGFHFDVKEQNCNYKDVVDCKLGSEVSTECSSQAGVEIIPHPLTCSKYTVCFNGIKNDRECEPGLHFSPYDGKCVKPFLADCDYDRILCKNAVGNIPLFLENPRDCQSYFLCLGEIAVTLRCHAGSSFDITVEKCVPSEESECKTEIPANPPTIPDKISTEECEGRSGILLPHPDSCQFYFICGAGRSYLAICGIDLIFDESKSSCQTPANGSCDREVITPAPIKAPNEAPGN